MSNKKIFENYQSHCPTCGAELDANNRVCPYCGNELCDENQEYRNDEEKIVEAFEDIDEAKQRLEQTEDLFNKVQEEKERTTALLKEVEVNKSKTKVFKWILLILLAPSALFIIAGLVIGAIGAVFTAHVDNKIETYIEELNVQDVKTIQVESVDVSNIEFTNTQYQSSRGYIQESDEYIKISLYSDSYSNELVVSGEIVVEKTGFNEVHTCQENYCHIDFGDYSSVIEVDNSPYYNRAIDAANIYDTGVVRLDDVSIDEYLFECYKDGSSYTFICNLGDGCFIKYETYFYGEDDAHVSDTFKIKHIDIVVE